MRAPLRWCLWSCELLALAACGRERDVDLFVVMPLVDDVCTHADLDRVELRITGPGPEDFTLRASGCRRQAEFMFDGFFTAERGGQLVLDHLQEGFYRIDASVFGSDGSLRGTRSLPIDARTSPQAIIFERPDLPGWPTLEVEVIVPACRVQPDLVRVHIVATPVGAFVPAATATVGCVTGQPTRARFDLPIGPVELTGEGMLDDETVCHSGAATVLFTDERREAELPLDRLCP